MNTQSHNYPALGQYINGQWFYDTGNDVLEVINPATEERLGELPKAGAEHIDEALKAAQEANASWRTTPVEQRAALLHAAAGLLRERATDIATIITLEQGRPLKEALDEVERSAQIIDWNAQAAVDLLKGDKAWSEGTSLTTLNAIGPVAAFTPWNVPLMSPARKVSMSLAAGCPCILKPAEETPASAVELVRAFADAGVPAGVLGLLLGDPAYISDALIRSPIVRKITFTGSVPVGKHIAALAGSFMKPVTMELGGHNAAMILADADIDRVARQAAIAKFRNAGQICTSPTRFYIQAEKYAQFLDAFAAETASLTVGCGFDAATRVGPLVNKRRLQAVSQLVDETVELGAQVITGGTRVGTKGYFYAPTILTNIHPESSFMLQEPFGPVAGVFPFDDVADGLALCNDSSLGLAAYVFTGSTAQANTVASGLESGVVGINQFSVSRPQLPFGGVKDSGYGREGGIAGIKAFLVTKALI